MLTLKPHESLYSFMQRFCGNQICVTVKTYARVGGLATPVTLKTATYDIEKESQFSNNFSDLLEIDTDKVYIEQWAIEMIDTTDGNMIPCLVVFVEDIPDSQIKLDGIRSKKEGERSI